MFSYKFKCEICGCVEGKIVLVDNTVFVSCKNEDCLVMEELDYIRWN